MEGTPQGTKEKHQKLFTTILQDNNNDVSKFLDSVFEFMDEKTIFRHYGNNPTNKLLKMALHRRADRQAETHLDKKKVMSVKRKSPNELADQDESTGCLMSKCHYLSHFIMPMLIISIINLARSQHF